MTLSRMWLILVLCIAVGRPCWGAEAEKTIYGGQPLSEAGITLGSWGSGSAIESGDKKSDGSKSIKVVTEGWFTGGSIEFNTPVLLFSGKADAADFLLLTIAPTPGSASEGATYDYSTESAVKPKIERLRVVLRNDKGKRQEMIRPLLASSDGVWWKVGVPLAKINMLANESDYSLKRLLIFSDTADTIYIGSIKIVRDAQPLKAEPDADLSYAIGDRITFRAKATGGLSPIKCSWDFDSKDGVQEDAVGQSVTHAFATAGSYVVTLTVSDLNGLKPACVKTIKARID